MKGNENHIIRIVDYPLQKTIEDFNASNTQHLSQQKLKQFTSSKTCWNWIQIHRANKNGRNYSRIQTKYIISGEYIRMMCVCAPHIPAQRLYRIHQCRRQTNFVFENPFKSTYDAHEIHTNSQSSESLYHRWIKIFFCRIWNTFKSIHFLSITLRAK